jgi:hypothetical protein
VAPTIPEDRQAATLFGSTTKTTPGQQAPTAGPGALFYDAKPKPTPAPAPKPTVAPAPDKQAEALFGADAPVDYQFTIPVGYDHLVADPGKHEQFVAHCRANRISQKDAQALVELHVRASYEPRKG